MKKKRTGPGRPQGESFARDRILKAAEMAFAEHGYAGTSLREIVKRAHVTQALITYYFGSKEALFKEVFLRRGREIATQRLAALNALRQQRKPFTLTDVVASYLRPALEMRSTREGRAFIRLQSRMHTEPPRFADRLRRDVYDDTVREYLSAIRKAAPHLSEPTAYWRMVLLIGAYLYAHSDSHRLEKMSGGLCTTDDLDEMLRQITAFVVGGLMAPDFDGKQGTRRRKRGLSLISAPGSA
jgi:AcrR family transcriptional regulator